MKVFCPAPDTVDDPEKIVVPADTYEPVPTKFPPPFVTVDVALAVSDAPAFIVNAPEIVKAELAEKESVAVLFNVSAITFVVEGSVNVVIEPASVV